MAVKKRILVAPIDWGLGHATRCIPIIREIISQGHEAILAADGRAYDLLKNEFPALTIVRLKGYRPVYPHSDSMVFKMLQQVPKFLLAIAHEHFKLKELIKKYSIDIVISDNRYGLWHPKKPSIFITHQLFIKMPAHLRWFELPVNRMNHYFIQRFHRCWIPDEEGTVNLSGELSHGKRIPSNAAFIGMLPRFSVSHPVRTPFKFEILVLLSGPEPQRSILEKEILKQLKNIALRALVVRGVTEEMKSENREETEIISYLTSKALQDAMQQSEMIVCRAGYSTLMELAALGKRALIIPTPGQTEQEYLAELCSCKNYFITQQQSGINLEDAIEKLQNGNFNSIYFNAEASRKNLKKLIQEL